MSQCCLEDLLPILKSTEGNCCSKIDAAIKYCNTHIRRKRQEQGGKSPRSRRAKNLTAGQRKKKKAEEKKRDRYLGKVRRGETKPYQKTPPKREGRSEYSPHLDYSGRGR